MTFTLSRNVQQYISIVGSIILQFPLGQTYVQGNVIPYIVSYLHSIGKYDIGTEVWITSFFYAGFLSVVFTTPIEKAIGLRCTIIVGLLFVNIGFITTFYSIQYSMWGVVVTFGLLPGIGVAQCINVTILNVIKWMPKRIGVGVSLVLTGSGSGVILVNTIVMHYINPDNLQTNESLGVLNVYTEEGILGRIPYLFLVLAAIAVAVSAISVPMIITAPENMDEDEQIILEEKKNHGTINNINGTNMSSYSARHLEVREVLKQPAAYILALTAALVTGSSTVFMATYKSFAERFIKTDVVLTQVAGVAAFLAATSRIVFGLLADKISHKFCIMIICGLLFVLLQTIHLTEYLGVVGFSVWFIIILILYGGSLSVFRSAIPKSFGLITQSTNQIMLSIGYFVAAFAISPFVSIILSQLGWKYLYGVIGAMPCLGFILMIFFNLRLPDGTRV